MSKNLYIRADCDNGVLTNEEDIAYYKATQEVEIISNYLLGDFNEDGKYIINEEMINELVSIPKGVTNEFSNMIFCVSHVITDYVETEKFVVKIRYDEDDPSIKISTLEVLEDVKKVDGYFVNSLSTPIAEYVDIATDNYKEKMFNAFNIIDKSQLSSSMIDIYAHGKISLRRKFVASIQKICSPQLEEVNKQAYLKKLEILKQSGKVGEQTIKLFEDRLKNKPVIATKNNYKALNELIDSVIEVHKEQLKPIMPEIRKVGIEFSEKVEQIKKLSFQNLKNIQKTPLAIKAIQSEQDAVFNNKLAQKPNIKQIISQEVKETDYKKKEEKSKLDENANQKTQQEPKKERVDILKTLFGLGEKKKEEKKIEENKVEQEHRQKAENINKEDNNAQKPSTNAKPTLNTETVADKKTDKQVETSKPNYSNVTKDISYEQENEKEEQTKTNENNTIIEEKPSTVKTTHKSETTKQEPIKPENTKQETNIPEKNNNEENKKKALDAILDVFGKIEGAEKEEKLNKDLQNSVKDLDSATDSLSNLFNVLGDFGKVDIQKEQTNKTTEQKNKKIDEKER